MKRSGKISILGLFVIFFIVIGIIFFASSCDKEPKEIDSPSPIYSSDYTGAEGNTSTDTTNTEESSGNNTSGNNNAGSVDKMNNDESVVGTFEKLWELE